MFRPDPRRFPSAPILALALACAIAVPAGAAPAGSQDVSGIERPAPSVLDEQVAALVARLADPSWSIRQAAQDQLVALGLDALPALERSRRAATDLQTRAAVELVESQIAANTAQLGRPIFLRLHEADAAAAVREIAQQAGFDVQIEERRLMGVKLSGQIDGRRWWPAMLQLCARYDLDVRPLDSGLRITRATDGAMRTLGGPMSVHGPMVILARGAYHEQRITLERAPSDEQSLPPEAPPAVAQARFGYQFEAMLEPRFVLGSRRFIVLLTGAIDDAGNVLLPGGAADGMDLRRELGAAGAGPADALATAAGVSEGQWTSGRLPFEVLLRYPESPGRTLRLEGRVRALVGAEIVETSATATDLAAGATWHVAGERIDARLEPSPAAGRWALTITSGRALATEVADIIASSLASAELTDAAGDRFRRGATQTSTGSDGRLTCRLEFIGPSDESMQPRQLRCLLPRRALELDIPFAFDNLPMP